MDRLYVLKNNEGMMARCKKLNEEFHEVVAEVEIYTVAGGNKERLASELLDLMQVAAGMLDDLDINISDEIFKHNLKLLGRGWKFKKPLFKLTKKSLFKMFVNWLGGK